MNTRALIVIFISSLCILTGLTGCTQPPGKGIDARGQLVPLARKPVSAGIE